MSDLTPKQARELWAQALGSGQYKQGKERLTTVTDSGELDCCLGVACKVAIKHGVLSAGAYYGAAADLSEHPVVQRWLGLRTEDGTYTMSSTASRSLTADNDGGWTFTDIAATIRAEPEGLVVA
jgi:hypothetical protein